MPFLCPGIWECLRLRTQGRQRCGRHSDVWSLYPLLPQTASFMSGHQVSTVSRSPPYLRQMSAGSCPSKTFKDSAGSAPDTWWPPDLQNVIQGRCGRQAGKQASRQASREGGALGSWRRHPDGATGARLHPTLHCTRLSFFTKGSTLQSAVSLCAGLRIFAARVSAIGSAPRPVWSQT